MHLSKFTFVIAFCLITLNLKAQLKLQVFFAGHVDSLKGTVIIYGDNRLDVAKINKKDIVTMQPKANDPYYKNKKGIYLVGVKPGSKITIGNKEIILGPIAVMGDCSCCSTPPYTCYGKRAHCETMSGCHPVENCKACINYL
ncbi:hypothetical protein ACFS5N_17950 [Mucilaginibacter ximonensis]|uniref:Uncharacterized protein n=1 Tax=Mucilaginibacter ximonensis TaxID=538021 RepID=A0ABW5YGE8_9SPHI